MTQQRGVNCQMFSKTEDLIKSQHDDTPRVNNVDTGSQGQWVLSVLVDLLKQNQWILKKEILSFVHILGGQRVNGS